MAIRNKLQLDDLYFKCNGDNTLIQRLGLRYRLKLCKSNSKINELSKLLKGNPLAVKFKHAELVPIAEDIKRESTLVPCIIKDSILALLSEGEKASYIAVFNLSKSAVKLYADISCFKDMNIQDGVITEIFSGDNYLVSGGKIYIRRFPAMDCMLFAKYK